MIDDYRDYDALGLAALIRQGETTALELLESALAKAEARNDRINAITAFFEEAARLRASQRLPDTPLAGVPFLVKDLVYI